MFRGSSVMLAGMVAAGSFAPLWASPVMAPSAYAEEVDTYVVVSGDNLSSIARRFGVTVAGLVAVNGLTNPDRIYVGQRLVLPGGSEPAPAPMVPLSAAPAASYSVAPGDTLSAIAARFGTTVAALVQANGLTDPNRIYVGQQLVMPGAGSPVAAASRSLLQTYRLVTYYGMAGKPTMGILGQLAPGDLVRSVKEQAAAVTAAGGKPALPALHIVAAQAMREPDQDGKYRRRVDPAIIREYVDLAGANGLQIILDLQTGQSPVADEIAALAPFLAQPHVHLALDAEYAMPRGVAPGTQLGSLDAQDINAAIQTLARLVQERNLPNKVLLVHQFRPSMITNRAAIAKSPLVDLAINMDGHGDQGEKAKWYRFLLGNQSVAFASLQIFLRLDAGPFTPAQALALSPAPDVLVYF